MKKNKLLKHLKLFIEPHPVFQGSDEEIYSVREKYRIILWIKGGFKLQLEPLTYEINFNIIRSGILVISNRNKENIQRILTKSIIAIELLRECDSEEENLNVLLALKDIQKN